MRIAIVKEPSIFLEGILSVMEVEFPNYDVVTTTPGNIEALDAYIIDLVIFDIDSKENLMPSIQRYLDKNKKVIVWTENMHHPDMAELFSMDLHGYFYNGMEREDLVHAIKRIIAGHPFVNETLAGVLLGTYREKTSKEPQRPVGIFTNREWQVMELLAEGYSNQRISETLYITDKTVKNHISSILRKLNVPDRTNAVLYALKNRWFVI